MRYEELKEPLKLCTGTRKGSEVQCSGTLHKCGACGEVGCRQTHDGNCTGQVFNVLGGCIKCGAVGKMEALPAGDYKTQQNWYNPSSATH
jgi:hypothetical protein